MGWVQEQVSEQLALVLRALTVVQPQAEAIHLVSVLWTLA
jgi:hypothetical protein